MNIVKTGLFIEDIEVTSEHIGKKLEVLRSNSDWLPVGFITIIEGISSDGVITLQDTGGEDSYCDVKCSDVDDWKFKWVTPPKPKKSSTKPQRRKLAMAVRAAEEVLQHAIQNAEDVGMVVSVSGNGIKITFNPPTEEY